MEREREKRGRGFPLAGGRRTTDEGFIISNADVVANIKRRRRRELGRELVSKIRGRRPVIHQWKIRPSCHRAAGINKLRKSGEELEELELDLDPIAQSRELPNSHPRVTHRLVFAPIPSPPPPLFHHSILLFQKEEYLLCFLRHFFERKATKNFIKILTNFERNFFAPSATIDLRHHVPIYCETFQRGAKFS